ncbi:hypothetical protein D3C80_2207950 [compost metagenome]
MEYELTTRINNIQVGTVVINNFAAEDCIQNVLLLQINRSTYNADILVIRII